MFRGSPSGPLSYELTEQSHSQLEAGVVPPHLQLELLSSGCVGISHLEQAVSSEVLNKGMLMHPQEMYEFRSLDK